VTQLNVEVEVEAEVEVAVHVQVQVQVQLQMQNKFTALVHLRGHHTPSDGYAGHYLFEDFLLLIESA
jgi:hypothetical protein